MNNKQLNLPTPPDNVEEMWASFRDTIHSTALEVLGPATRNHKDRFDENDIEIENMLDEKYRLLCAHQSDPSCPSKKTTFFNERNHMQSKLRNMQEKWLNAKADEIQGYADMHDIKQFYDALKDVYGPQASAPYPILWSDWINLITEKSQILDRWAEHFDNVLNRPSTKNNEAIQRLPQTTVNSDLDNLLATAKVEKALKQMSTEKSPWSDAIPTEVYKAGGLFLLNHLTRLFQSFWKNGAAPRVQRCHNIPHLQAQRKSSVLRQTLRNLPYLDS